MSINLETTKRIAELSKLDPTWGQPQDQQQALWGKMMEELNSVINHIDVLQQADIQGQEPLYTPMFQTLGPRQDIAKPSDSKNEILDQSPSRVGNYFAVPKIV